MWYKIDFPKTKGNTNMLPCLTQVLPYTEAAIQNCAPKNRYSQKVRKYTHEVLKKYLQKRYFFSIDAGFGPATLLKRETKCPTGISKGLH